MNSNEPIREQQRVGSWRPFFAPINLVCWHENSHSQWLVFVVRILTTENNFFPRRGRFCFEQLWLEYEMVFSCIKYWLGLVGLSVVCCNRCTQILKQALLHIGIPIFLFMIVGFIESVQAKKTHVPKVQRQMNDVIYVYIILTSTGPRWKCPHEDQNHKLLVEVWW